MPETASNADQIAYWNGEVGEKWVKEQARLDRMLEPFTVELLAAARLAPADNVLDVGCGCGATSLRIAAQAAQVLGADISEPMIAQAKSAARLAGVRNADFIVADAAAHRFTAFDLLFSRFGVMFFADPKGAFANLRAALKPKGRLAFACWRDWRENEWAREPVLTILPHVPPPQVSPDAPGPFAFADRVKVERILTGAGFRNVAVRAFDAKLSLGATAAELAHHLLEFGPASRLLAEANDEQKARAKDALLELAKRIAARKPVAMDGAVWIVTATRD